VQRIVSSRKYQVWRRRSVKSFCKYFFFQFLWQRKRMTKRIDELWKILSRNFESFYSPRLPRISCFYNARINNNNLLFKRFNIFLSIELIRYLIAVILRCLVSNLFLTFTRWVTKISFWRNTFLASLAAYERTSHFLRSENDLSLYPHG